MVLWSKSSTLDRKVEGSNPAAANFSFEVDDLDGRRKKEDGNEIISLKIIQLAPSSCCNTKSKFKRHAK